MKQLRYEPMLKTAALVRESEDARNSRKSRTSRTSRASRQSRYEPTRRAPQPPPHEVKPKLLPKKQQSISQFSFMHSREGLTGKKFWQDVIEEVEFVVHCKTLPPIPIKDYSVVLPAELRDRVKKIQKYRYDRSDDDIYIREEMREERPLDYMTFSESETEEPEIMDEATLILEAGRKKVEEHFSESEHSEIVRLDHEFEKFELKLDDPVGHTHRVVDSRSWMAKFLCAPRHKRVKWKSRVQTAKTKASVKLDEEAEKLMDASAERFVEWLNSIGTLDTGMTPKKIKSLFDIKGDRTLLASIKTDPKEVNAIAATVAQKWNKPEMAIELKYEKHINDHATRVCEKPMLSAFGRTVPMKERPWMKRSTDTFIETVFPEELLTRQKLFKGITHLRSTSILLEFYQNYPKLPFPVYLKDCSDLELVSLEDSNTELPLYEFLGVRY
ncbi:uncharacterized protein LOC115626895 [Scaptodrosophila lebanonensis]|uniref:Uncharacterized protein LOC115626895 n=1 Tax=Drosophila lebanonensis TaxID=7225 RepID=A0A6J2TRX0_DROLE|nr:uncharacterized protein LOC115626895 [Scaptodrosophila lebanonensis]